nr:uncharacterized protein LOC122271791 [Parasteatoda tepidariorum]
MFADGCIAKQFSCVATKCAYVCSFGLAPYFKGILINELKNVDCYTVLFDETLNQSLQSKQMDMMVRYMGIDNKVCTRCLTSQFMGHGTAENILSSFYKCMNDGLRLSKILQLSMDEPYINWKFYEMLQCELKEEYSHLVISIGSCGLHIMNNAFKHGENATSWHINEILSSLYWLFQDSPARTSDFLSLSSLKKMPLKFYKCRWLENIPAVERAIEIWSDVESYVKCVDKGMFNVFFLVIAKI